MKNKSTVFNTLLSDILATLSPSFAFFGAGLGIINAAGFLFDAEYSSFFILAQSVFSAYFDFSVMLICYSAASSLGLSPLPALLSGAILTRLDFPEGSGEGLEAEYIELLGIEIQKSSTSTSAAAAVSVMLIIYFISKLKPVAALKSPLRGFAVGCLSFAGAFFLALPLLYLISSALGYIFMFFYNYAPLLDGAFIGGFYSLISFLGLEEGIASAEGAVLAVCGRNTLLPLIFCSHFAFAGGALASAFKKKSAKAILFCLLSFIASALGFPQAAISELSLKNKRILLLCIASGAFWGIFMKLCGIYFPSDGEINGVLMSCGLFGSLLAPIFLQMLFKKD